MKGGDERLSEINPIKRLYEDIIRILNSITIKYKYKADELETFESKSKADRYINALSGTDTYLQYDDYTAEEFIRAGITDEKAILSYQIDRFSVPSEYRSKLLQYRREREISEYVEQNNYYRMLIGEPDLEDTDFIYPPDDLREKYNIPEGIPVHKIASELGDYYITLLDGEGYFDDLIAQYPEKEYLKHIGTHRITLSYARQAKNFAILAVEQENVMESTYREFIRSYEKCRNYFMSTAYTYELRNVIPYYENFIALCIFIMTIQQVSMRSVQNAVEREFYDEYMVKLLYETYGLPYFSRIDEQTQKQICQNLNLLIQNKATNKVILDIASILGFSDISIYQYYLVKEQGFDDNGRPIIKKKTQINTATGKEEEVYDYESMHSVYFQKVDITETNIKEALSDKNNRVEYSEVTYYDPFWWEDDELHTEIWDRAYNYQETKYLGATIPYRITELVFQCIILMRMIIDQSEKLGEDLTVNVNKITNTPITLKDAVILFFALVSKKFGVSGQIMTTPSKIIHILETTDQEINRENEHIEVLSFNFDAFTPERIEETKAILAPYLSHREYKIVNGHDVDLKADGTQDTTAPTHLVSYTTNEDDLNEFFDYITQLTIPDTTAEEKREALNNAFTNIEALYLFLSYQMSNTQDLSEYYAIRKFYETAFYSTESSKMFEVETEEGVRPAETFEEYFLYTNSDIYNFLQELDSEDTDTIYSYIDHVIYKMEEVVDDVGYLYLLNDGESPLTELLQIMIKFFKSYVMDFVDMSSLMIIDWEMENTIRFFSEANHIHKVDELTEEFGQGFLDTLNSLMVHYNVEDELKLEEYLKIHATAHVEDSFDIYDLKEGIRIAKVNAVNEAFDAYDVVDGITGTIRISSDLNFTDTCVKKIKEDDTDVQN